MDAKGVSKVRTVRILIADDEEMSRVRLRNYLAKEPHVEIVAESTNGLEAVQAIRDQKPDIAFIDIKMPELDGFGVLAQLDGDRIPAIVFVTAFDKFALEAFDLNAVDYLLKPFDRERFQRAFQRAQDRLTQASMRQNESQVKELLDYIRAKDKPLQRLTVRHGDRYLLINTSDIDWISSADNYTELHVAKATHLLRSSITTLARQLSPAQFIRVNRSALVNQERVRQIRPKSHGDAVITLHTGATLTATRTYRRAWETLLKAST